MSRPITAQDRKRLIRLASGLPKGSEGRKAILAGLEKTTTSRRAYLKNAGALRYDGNTPLDKVYAMTDLLNEIGRGLPTGSGRSSEFSAVRKALFKLEAYVKKETKEASLR